MYAFQVRPDGSTRSTAMFGALTKQVRQSVVMPNALAPVAAR